MKKLKLFVLLSLLIACSDFGQNTAEDYTESGKSKFNLKDFNGALADYNKAIELNPDYLFAYMERGYLKYALEDYRGAIADYTKAIELRPDYMVNKFVNTMRETAQDFLDKVEKRGDFRDETGALLDYTKAMADYDQAIALNYEDADVYMKRGYAKYWFKDYKDAIVDYSRAIELKPNAISYSMRGLVKSALFDYRGAIDDYTKGIELKPTTKSEFLWNSERKASLYQMRGCAKNILKDYIGALADYNNSIKLDPTNGIKGAGFFYMERAEIKYNLQDLDGACLDWSKAGELFGKLQMYRTGGPYDKIFKYCR